MRIAIKMLTVLLLLTTTIFALSDKELAITIDLSGKQRMLTQKMAKEAFLIKSNIDKKTNIKKLTQSSKLFDKTLNGLLVGDKELELVALKDDKIEKQLKKVVSIWEPFYKEIKNILNNKSSEKSYTTICDKNSELLKEINLVFKYYILQQKKSNFVLTNDMNLAEKQKILLQKMEKALLISNNGIKTQEHKDEFLNSQKLFTKILKGLLEGNDSLKLRGVNLPEIKKQLRVVEQLWNKEQKNLQNALSNKSPLKAIDALENVSIEMDKSVKLYTASFNRQQQRDEFASLINIHTSLEKMDSETKFLLEKLAKAETE
ncbi:Nitric oxide-responding transcriptional regulator Dnr (Crp/Fnr family) [hydrothermal vent metagenome]|uniref:Nitric oxide-responding transcriptional regulator Dnr (Crp/Fnr family) n=1 Tax=hydrothermal vent metagenome TaxID=652676 RepID=A0A1W1BVU0_9ZZZZ